MSSGLYSGVSGLALGSGLYRNVSGLWGGASGLINGFGGGGPFPGASLYLDFLTPPLDSRITFSRGTNAMLVDSTGRVTYAPNNLVQQSEAFDNVYWARAAVNVTADATTAPNGTLTADKVFATATTGIHGAYANITLTATTHIYSCYAKAAEYSLVRLSEGASGRFYASFNLSNGTVVAGTTGGTQFVSASIIPVGDGWYRCAIVFTGAAGAYAVAFAGYPAGATLNIYGVDYTGDGVSGTFFWGAQLEQVTYQTTPGTYNATTASAYYGPRFDYDPVTLAPRGLLIEEARTNVFTYSEQFDNAAWTKITVTATANTTTSPDGTVDADSLVASGGSAQHFINQSLSFTSGTTYTLSVFAKKNTLNGVQLTFGSGAFGTLPYANFDLNAGTSFASNCTATLTNFGNGWYRCTITATANGTTTAGAVIGLARDTTEARLATFSSDGNGIFIYGAQLEAGAFATSYIPTVASTVSRSADVAQMTGTNFSTWYNQSEGTFVVEAARGEVNVIAYILTASDNSAAEWIGTYFATSQRVGATIVDGSVTQMAVVTANNSAPINTITKAAVAYKLNDSNLAANGVALTTDTSCTIPTTNRLYIGSDVNGAGQHVNGHIRAIAYYNTRLPNTQLQTLTAPSLASPLALDFISPTYTVGY